MPLKCPSTDTAQDLKETTMGKQMGTGLTSETMGSHEKYRRGLERRLGALAALVEDLGLKSSTDVVVHTT